MDPQEVPGCLSLKNQLRDFPGSPVLKTPMFGTSLVVKWLRLCASNAGDAGSIPGQGTKIPYATYQGQKINENIFKKIKIKKNEMGQVNLFTKQK